MTKFSFEVPLAHMNDFEDLQDFHFALSLLFQKTLNYRRFIERQIEEGLKTVWLDNSYNEQHKADDPYSMGRLARVLDCQKVIAPDDPSWEDDMHISEALKLAKWIPLNKIVLVAHRYSTIPAGWGVGLNHIAVPYGSRYTTEPWMREKHLLGILTVKELQQLTPASCDTGMPVKIAREGWTLNVWEIKGCPHLDNFDRKYKSFFDWKLKPSEVELARKNIIDLKEAVNGSI